METRHQDSDIKKDPTPPKDDSDDSKDEDADSEESIRESSAERLAKNPYISSSSPSQSEDESPRPRKFSRSKSRSRSRSRSRSLKRREGEEPMEKFERRHYHESIEGFQKAIGSYNRQRRSPEGGLRKPRITRPGLNGPLLSYKHFMELQRDPIDPEDAEKHYADYKNAHIQKQNEIFFHMHKDDHWFREKYHPEQSYQWQTERRVQAQLLAKKFFEQLKKGQYNGIRLEAPLDEVSFKLAESSGTIDITKPPYFGFDPNSVTLYLKALPVTISRWDVLNEVKHTPGFVSLSLSEPLKTQDFVRYAWVSYDSEENCSKSRLLLENTTIGNFKLAPIKSQSAKKNARITPPLTTGRESIDLDLSRKLIQLLDEEKQIKENELLPLVSKNDPIVQLDLQILYLRKVHALCYYSAEEYDDERMLAAKCGPVHLRSGVRIPQEKVNEHVNTKIFEDRINSYVEKRLARGPALLQKPGEGDPKVEKMKEDFYFVNIVKTAEDKYACAICSKPFMGENYVRKHLDNKHYDKLYESRLKKYFEEQMFKNYCADENRFTNQPSAISTITVPQGHYGKKFEDKRKSKLENYMDLDDPQQQGKTGGRGEPGGRPIISYDDL